MATIIEARIAAVAREDQARLAAKAAHLTLERETGGWIVRNPKVPGRIELVSDAGACTCRRHTVWGSCRHSALIAHRATMQAMTGHEDRQLIA